MIAGVGRRRSTAGFGIFTLVMVMLFIGLGVWQLQRRVEKHALIVEVKYQPPFWLHAALWLPLILATTLLPLRSMKALLIALQFHHKAAEGRLIDREP